jgi:hypothetical protein
LAADSHDPAGTTPRNEYTVDELARVTDTTVRNVRAYQDRDLRRAAVSSGRARLGFDSKLGSSDRPGVQRPHCFVHVDLGAVSRSRVFRLAQRERG